MKLTIKDIGATFVSWSVTLVVRVIAILAGLIMVPLGLAFTKLPDPDATEWQYIGLPKWCDPWDNVRDGAMGDKRMWWWLKGYPTWVDSLPRKMQSFVKAFWWLAIRNSANKLARYYAGFGCPIDKCEIDYIGDYRVSDDIGGEGFQFVKASGPIFNYYSIYHHIALPQKGFFKGKALIARMGHKVEPRHADKDWSLEEPTKRFKNWTFRPYLLQRVD